MLTLLLTGMLTPVFNLHILEVDESASARVKSVGEARASAAFSSLPWTDWKHYHNYTEIVDTLLYLNSTYPNIVDVFSIGKSWKNRDIYCIRLTKENTVYPKPKVLFVGYHHAREPISAELPLYFVVYSAQSYGVNATITRMLDLSEIYVVPALNPDGLDIIKVNDFQRKNAHPCDEDSDGLFDEDPPDDEDIDGRIEYLMNTTTGEFIRWEGLNDDSDGLFNEDWIGGVDLNRNYGYQWNAICDSGSPYPWAEDYRGPAPFSEPETQAIRDLALRHNFKYAISFHSGSELILYPWGYTNTPTSDDQTFMEVAANLSVSIGAAYEQAGLWYTTSGVWDDWMYASRKVFALTCEVFSNDSAWIEQPGPSPDTVWVGGILGAFNPVPSQIESVILRWMPAFTYITNRAICEACGPEQFGPRVDNILIEMYPNCEVEFNAIDKGEIDIVDWPLTKYWVDKFSTDPRFKVVNSGSEAGYFILDINNNYMSKLPDGSPNPVYPNPCANVKVRQAIAHLVNRTHICIDIAQGLGLPIYTPVPSYMSTFINLDVPKYEYSLSTAMNLLTEAKLLNTSEGSPVTWRYWDRNGNGKYDGASEDVTLIIYGIDSGWRKQIAIDITAELNKVQVQTDLRLRSYYVCRNDVFGAKKHHIYTGGWPTYGLSDIGPDPDYLYDLYHSSMYWHPGMTPNYNCINDTELDNALEGIKFASTFEEGLQSTLDAQTVFASKCLSIPLFSSSSYKVVRKSYLGTPSIADDEDKYEGKNWQGVVNEAGFGVNTWWTFLNAHPSNYPMGDGGHMTMRYGLGTTSLFSLNPIYANQYWDWEVLGKIYDVGAARNPYSLEEWLPQLYTHWEQGLWVDPVTGETKSKVRVTLRPDVYWSDGVPLSVADVAFTLVEVPEMLLSKGWPPPSWYPEVCDVISVDIIDPCNVEILLDAQSFWLIGRVIGNIILPKHVWKPIIEASSPANPIDGHHPDPNLIGTGPYRLKEYVEGSHILLVANRPCLTVTTNLENAIPITNPAGFYKAYPIDVSIGIVNPPEYEQLQRVPPYTNITLNVAHSNLLITTEPYLGWLITEKRIEITYPNGTEEVIGPKDINLTIPDIESIARSFSSGHYQIKAAVQIKGPAQLAPGISNPWIGQWKNITYDFWITITEDINADGIVDISDILDVALHFGTYPGHPRWNSNCDLDDNGIVDISDILGTALHYGETDP
jgi:ABC-type transport system substrate-binding protein